MTEKPQSTVRLGLWLTFAAFLLIIFVFKNQISEIHFDAKGVSAKMNPQDVSTLAPEDRKNAEGELAQRVNTLEEQARSNPQPAPPQAANQNPPQISDTNYQQQALPTIAGYWTSPSGTTYQVNQYGNYVAISEMSMGVTDAVATGQIFGWSFNLSSYNLAGRSGVLSLQVSADQRQMSGQYQDSMSGAVVPMQLNR
jgi:hypothetical protein